ncbi:OLC1v1037063C1 [Oldenlandia corymbosa var. corymbosa]|uniref:OLC1v1037063C1 n=1 Tax=Oldenlandia corymbosa var. corymbosa TaxID=529605 RepID=A0AAV1CWN9_OLDCO|nr:OLC1v1037063C1 [Oldenlandia corymbosa var. corymbosa]
MSSILTSEGMVLATAMAVSGTVILLAFRLQKSTLHQFEMMVNAIPPGQSPVSLPRPCISASSSPSNSPSSSSSDGKKKDKKKKRVHFAADVVDPIGNSDEYRKNFHSNRASANNATASNSNSDASTTRNYGGKAGGMPANRAALYSGILRDRAPEDFRVTWDHRESQEMGVIIDVWSKSDKARIKQYRDDITALESLKNDLNWTKVQQYIPPIPVKDKKGSLSKVNKKRKLMRLVKASEAGAKSKKKKQAPPVEKEGLVEEVEPVEEDKTKGAAENPDTSPGSSSYTAAAAIFHFRNDRIECPIIEEVAETMTDEEALKKLTTSLASILMRKKKLREKISNLELEKGFLEQEKAIHEEAKKNKELMRATKEEELATAQAIMMPTERMANVMVGISEAAIALGGHGVAVAALERMESGKPVNAGWLKPFMKPHPHKTLHEAMKNGLMHLGTKQLPLFRPLCSAIPQMGSPSEITSFEGDALTVLPAEPGKEMRVPKLNRDFIGAELVSDEDSSENVEEDKEEERGLEVEKEPAGKKEISSTQTLSREPVRANQICRPTQMPYEFLSCNRIFATWEPYYVHNVHLMILEEDEIKHFPMYAMISSALRKFGNVHNTTIVRAFEKEIVDAVQAYNVQIHSCLVQCFQQKEEEWRRRLHQYDLDFQDSLILDASINDEKKKLKDENARLRKCEKIAVSPWFLEKFELLALVEKQIEVRTERFIAPIDLQKKRTKEVEFYSKQVVVLQNILADEEMPLPIFYDLDPDDEAKERTAAEEYLLRLDEQD